MNSQIKNRQDKDRIVSEGQLDLFWYLLEDSSASQLGFKQSFFSSTYNHSLEVGDPVKYLDDKPAGTIKIIRGNYAVLEPFLKTTIKPARIQVLLNDIKFKVF